MPMMAQRASPDSNVAKPIVRVRSDPIAHPAPAGRSRPAQVNLCQGQQFGDRGDREDGTGGHRHLLEARAGDEVERHTGHERRQAGEQDGPVIGQVGRLEQREPDGRRHPGDGEEPGERSGPAGRGGVGAVEQGPGAEQDEGHDPGEGDLPPGVEAVPHHDAEEEEGDRHEGGAEVGDGFHPLGEPLLFGLRLVGPDGVGLVSCDQPGVDPGPETFGKVVCSHRASMIPETTEAHEGDCPYAGAHRYPARPLRVAGALPGCPSGQREQTVNLPAQPSEVRILLPPRDAVIYRPHPAPLAQR